MWIRTDEDRKKELEEHLLDIIDELRKNIVPVDVLIERTIIETNNSKKNLDDFCYEETLNFLKEEISLKENQENNEKYKPLNLEEILTENKFMNFFDNATDNGIDYYKSAVEGIESNDQSYMFDKIRYTLDEEEQNKERNSREKFAFYLKNSIVFVFSDLMAILKDKTNIMLLGTFVGMNAVAYYDLAEKIVWAFRSVFSNINIAFFPYFSRKNCKFAPQKYKTYIA